MSRVFDTPRYRLQSAYKVLSHIDVFASYSDEPVVRDDARAAFGNTTLQGLRDGEPAERMGEIGVYVTELAQLQDGEFADEDNVYERYSYAFGILQGSFFDYRYISAVGSVFSRILCEYAHGEHPRKVWTDYDAMARLTCKYLDCEYVCRLSREDDFLQRRCFDLSKDVVSWSFAACRLGKKAYDNYSTGIQHPSTHDYLWRCYRAWHTCFENLKLMGRSRLTGEGAGRLRDGDSDVELSKFSIIGGKPGKNLGCVEAFSVMGLYILVYRSDIYVLDYSSLEQVMLISKFWEGCFAYAANYRLSGNLNSARADILGNLKRCVQWLVRAMKESTYSEYLARSMKQSLALLQNELHTSAEKLNVNWEGKSRELKAIIADILPMSMYWHEFISRLDCTDRARLDLAHCYYGLPSPDCDVRLLIDRAVSYMAGARSVDQALFEDFMRYCKSCDLARVLVEKRSFELVSFVEEEGYSLRDSEWGKECIRGKLRLPPDEEMGKAWLFRHFEFSNTINSWYYEAADVTHINAAADQYKDVFTTAAIPRDSHNELIYALKHAPVLSYKWSPEDVMKKTGSGEDVWDRMAVLAAKSENTKPREKVRETWSADDCTRELTSMYDRQGIPLAQRYKGVTARKSEQEVNSIFDRIREVTLPDNEELCIIVSNDVSGWSPQGDREAWSVHHDYVVATTKAPSNLCLRHIWRGIRMGIDKRGYSGCRPLPKGLFQGWTGTLDSLLNVRLSLYCVRVAKRQGFLLKNEGATTAGLIDDAVQAVELGKDIEHAQQATDAHFRITCDTWSGLSAEISKEKTLVSSVKFIYLNKLFCEGSEVLTPMKVFARADRETKRRYAGVFAQVDSVFGAYRAAVEKGACPIAAYHSAVCRSLELVTMANKRLMGVEVVTVLNIVFAPRGLGGWGFPHLINWLTQEAPDSLTAYTTVMCSVLDSVADAPLRSRISALFYSTLNQELEEVNAAYFLKSPRDVKAVGVVSPEKGVLAKVKKGMLSKCTSPVFKAVLTAQDPPGVQEGLEQCIESCSWDATILELLGQCTPEACAASLLDRAYKNELVATLFPFRVRAEMSTIIRKQGARAVGHLLDIPITYGFHDDIPTRQEAFEIARDLREKFYEVNQVDIRNHTLPDYACSLARQISADSAMVTVTCGEPACGCSSSGEDYKNMYDGYVSRTRKVKTKSAFTFSGEAFKTLTPVELCVHRAAIVSTYVHMRNGDGMALWKLVCYLWGLKEVTSVPNTTSAIDPEASTKRIDPSTSGRSHPIACYRNTQDVVNVQGHNLGRYLASHSAHVDFMSFIQAARAVGLLEMATGGTGEPGLTLHYAVLSGSLPVSDKTTIKIRNEDDFDSGLEKIRACASRELEVSFRESMVDREFLPDDDPFIYKVAYSSRVEHRTTMITRVEVAPGTFGNFLEFGLPSATPLASKPRATIVRADETTSFRASRMINRFQDYARRVGSAHAVLMVLIDIVCQQTKSTLPDIMYTTSWPMVGTSVLEHIPGWESAWYSACDATRRYSSYMSQDLVNIVFATSPYAVKQKIMYLSKTSDEYTASAYGMCLLIGHGRLPSADSYTITAAYGSRHAAKSWSFASKRQRLLARGKGGAAAAYHGLMSAVYNRLSVVARNWNPAAQTRHVLLDALRAACSAHLSSASNPREVDDWDHGILSRNINTVQEMVSGRIIAFARFMKPQLMEYENLIKRDVKNLVADMVHFDSQEQLKIISDVELQPTFEGPTGELNLDIPDVMVIDIGDISGDDDSGDENEDIDRDNAVRIYLMHGIVAAHDFLHGARDHQVDMGVAVDNETRAEFEAELHEYEADVAGGGAYQEADEL